MINFKIQELKENTIPYISTLTENELVNVIDTLKDYYYNTNSPLVSNNTYDTIEDYCRKKYPSNLNFNKIGSVVKVKGKGKVKLPYFISSLDTIKPGTGLIKKFNDKYNGQFVISDKLDGQALLLQSVDFKWKVFRRGNGHYGHDISYISEYLNIPKPTHNDICIRAEFIILNDKFKSLYPNAKNARNTIAGILTRKSVNPNIVKEVDLVAYSMLYPSMAPLEQFKKLQSFGFKTPKYKIVDKFDEDGLSNYYIKRKKECGYAIDGLVVTYNEIYDNIKSGCPKHSKAFKLSNQDQSNEESVVANVKDVIWNISRYNTLKPVIIIDPVNICGVTVSKATGFHYKFIKDNEIGKDSKILIIRSGDVIPYVLEVIKKTTAILPTIGYHLSETGIDAIANSENIENKIKKINHFFKTIDVDSFRIGLITSFYINNFDTIQKIINMSINDMLTIDNIQEKRANIIYNNIHNSLQDITLDKLMVASGCFGKGFGIDRIKLILDNIPNILYISSEKILYERIINIKGFSENLTNQFINNIFKFHKFIDDINKFINIKNNNKNLTIESISDILVNENIIFTGFRDSNLTNLVLNNGGKISKSLSKNITLIVIKDENYKNTKVEKAMKMGIKILSKDDLANILEK